MLSQRFSSLRRGVLIDEHVRLRCSYNPQYVGFMAKIQMHGGGTHLRQERHDGRTRVAPDHIHLHIIDVHACFMVNRKPIVIVTSSTIREKTRLVHTAIAEAK